MEGQADGLIGVLAEDDASALHRCFDPVRPSILLCVED